MCKSMGRYIEEGLEKGTLKNEQVIVCYDKNSNIQYLGKAEFVPVFIDWFKLNRIEKVNNEIRFFEN